jgi:hypothetical protein
MRCLKSAHDNDAYWLKYLDGTDYEAVFVYGEETPQQIRDRRNKSAIMGAYRDALETRNEEESLAFVMEAIESVKTDIRFAQWSDEQLAKLTPEERAAWDGNIPF